MKIKDLLCKKDLKETMSMLRRVKETHSPKDEYIFRKLVYVAAHMSGLDGLREYDYFLGEFNRWINNKNPKLEDFMDIGARMEEDSGFYRIKVRTILCENQNTLEEELFNARNKALKNTYQDYSYQDYYIF